jgi:hypothetical protein
LAVDAPFSSLSGRSSPVRKKAEPVGHGCGLMSFWYRGAVVVGAAEELKIALLQSAVVQLTRIIRRMQADVA